MSITILGIESSCDDTSASVIQDGIILSNIIAGQQVHENFGGVVPELASRAHQQNIIPVIENALQHANIDKKQLNAIAYTRGPGLLGSLLVGASFAKGLSMSLGIPLIEIDHLNAHVFANFIRRKNDPSPVPHFPFLCLLVSGGHTQIIHAQDASSFEIIGQSIDDAAGEAFDKAAKILGLPYPGGPEIDKHARKGNPNAFSFPKPNVSGLDFSFSGLKTSFLYLIRDQLKVDARFIQNNLDDLCASYQTIIVEVLIKKLKAAVKQTGIKEITVAGGVSVNSALRQSLRKEEIINEWNLFLPEAEYCTDNAAMIAMAGYFKYFKQEFSSQSLSPYSRK